MKTKMFKSAIAALTLLSTSGMAVEDKLEELDTNKDGKISIEEAVGDTDLFAHFAALDANKDGYLDAQELRKAGY